MKGPFPSGTFNPSTPSTASSWETSNLIRSKSYRIVNSFLDADGYEHCAGDEWMFVTSMFNRYDDELYLCVRKASGDEWQIPMRWHRDAQGEILEKFRGFVVALDAGGHDSRERATPTAG